MDPTDRLRSIQFFRLDLQRPSPSRVTPPRARPTDRVLTYKGLALARNLPRARPTDQDLTCKCLLLRGKYFVTFCGYCLFLFSL